MLTLRLIAFLAIVYGLYRLLDIRFSEVLTGLVNRPRSIRDQVKAASGKKKNRLRRELDEVIEILKMTGRENKIPVIFLACGGLAAGGAVLASLLNNVFMIPVLSLGCMCIPIWYVKLTASHFRKELSEELETALSIITTAYLRNEDILTAVEENLAYLNSPIKEVFADFVIQLQLIDADILRAIETLKSKVDNDIFHEWCDALAACQNDRGLKSTLTPIIGKLSDIRVVNSELELLLAEPRKEFVIMALLLIANIPLIYFLNQDWYNILMHSLAGKLVLAIDMAAIFVSSAFVVKLTRPIEVRR